MSKNNGIYSTSEKIKATSFFIETYGCQMNVSDSNDIRKLLTARNLKESNSIEESDIIIINTCSVRSTAEQRVIGRLGFFKRLKSFNSNKIIILTGCMAERLSDRLIDVFPELDIVTGTHFKSDISEIINRYQETSCRKAYTGFKGYSFLDSSEDSNQQFKAFVPIIHGCDNFCSYCIVPYTRGRQTSKKSISIINNIRKLVNNGVIEITLLGQNVNSYGKDNNDISFSELLKQISKIKGLERIRFVTSHPKDFTKELAITIAENDKICKYLHLPFQSASDKVLKDMNRNYTYSKYLKDINFIRKLIPNISLSTDILVGFPTESEGDYQKTYDAMKDIEFDSAFMFKYSPREGTKAYNMKDIVEEETKLFRLQKIIELQNEITKKKNEKRIGVVEKVLFDYFSKNSNKDIIGKTDTFKNVVVKGNDELIGKIKNVKLISLSGNTFRGRIVD